MDIRVQSLKFLLILLVVPEIKNKLGIFARVIIRVHFFLVYEYIFTTFDCIFN